MMAARLRPDVACVLGPAMLACPGSGLASPAALRFGGRNPALGPTPLKLFAIQTDVRSTKQKSITLNGGSLGSCIDEERSEMR